MKLQRQNPCKLQKITILPEELSVQGGELGPTLKLKRHAIINKYQNLIDEIYANQKTIYCWSMNRFHM